MSNESKNELEHLSTIVLKTLIEGGLKVSEHGSEPFQELLSVHTDGWGVPDAAHLSDETQAVFKAAGKAMTHAWQTSASTATTPFNSDVTQVELFRLFSILFSSITGINYVEVFYNRNRRQGHLGGVSSEAF